MNGEEFDKDFQSRPHDPSGATFNLVRDASIIVDAWKHIMRPLIDKEEQFDGPVTVIRIIIDAFFPKDSYDAEMQKLHKIKLVKLYEEFEDVSILFFPIEVSRIPEKDHKAIIKGVEGFERFYQTLRGTYINAWKPALDKTKENSNDSSDEDVPELEK